MHLLKETIIFNAKIYAMDLVLDLITRNNSVKYVIFSDSINYDGNRKKKL